jgi:Tfp pilus assembly protein PilF
MLHSHKSAALRQLLNIARAQHPNWSAPDILLGKIADQEFDDEGALQKYALAVKTNPHCFLACSFYGNQLIKLEKPREAIVVMDKALALIQEGKPTDYYWLHYFISDKAKALHNLKDYNGAAATLSLDPDLATSFLSKKQLTLELLADKQWSRAVEVATGAVKLSNKSFDILYWRAQAYDGLGKTQAAIDDLTSYLVADQTRAQLTIDGARERAAVHTMRAKLYEKMGRMDLAKKDLREVADQQGKVYEEVPFRFP